MILHSALQEPEYTRFSCLWSTAGAVETVKGLICLITIVTVMLNMEKEREIGELYCLKSIGEVTNKILSLHSNFTF